MLLYHKVRTHPESELFEYIAQTVCVADDRWPTFSKLARAQLSLAKVRKRIVGVSINEWVIIYGQ
jgi:hypothetical protein